MAIVCSTGVWQASLRSPAASAARQPRRRDGPAEDDGIPAPPAEPAQRRKDSKGPLVGLTAAAHPRATQIEQRGRCELGGGARDWGIGFLGLLRDRFWFLYLAFLCVKERNDGTDCVATRGTNRTRTKLVLNPANNGSVTY
jgi:hypothetical protein